MTRMTETRRTLVVSDAPVTVHIFPRGHAHSLCGFGRGIPVAEWPAGHKAVNRKRLKASCPDQRWPRADRPAREIIPLEGDLCKACEREALHRFLL